MVKKYIFKAFTILSHILRFLSYPSQNDLDSEKKRQQILVRMWGMRSSHALLGGMQIDVSLLF